MPYSRNIIFQTPMNLCILLYKYVTKIMEHRKLLTTTYMLNLFHYGYIRVLKTGPNLSRSHASYYKIQ